MSVSFVADILLDELDPPAQRPLPQTVNSYWWFLVCLHKRQGVTSETEHTFVTIV